MKHFFYNYNNDEQDIFTKIAKYHIEFESIHPFENGNGRTGRLLINYEFLKNNDSADLAEWLKELSEREKERIKKFRYEG